MHHDNITPYYCDVRMLAGSQYGARTLYAVRAPRPPRPLQPVEVVVCEAGAARGVGLDDVGVGQPGAHQHLRVCGGVGCGAWGGNRQGGVTGAVQHGDVCQPTQRKGGSSVKVW